VKVSGTKQQVRETSAVQLQLTWYPFKIGLKAAVGLGVRVFRSRIQLAS
jgi:hypothetical protein